MKRTSSLGLGLALASTLAASAPAATAQAAPARARSFAIGPNDFLLDGKPYVIRSGEMHANRVPPQYWRHRLKMMKAMGLNTVCAYLFWNIHEPEEGKFNFQGAADVATYCRIAQEEGLYVVLRPGPYACAEWEFGGFPYWLLKTQGIKLRTRDPRYLAAVRKYLMQVGRQLAPLQVSKGGPILMVQVENEYGSYGSDKEYMGIVRDNLKEAGFTVPLFHCDGPSQLPADHRDDIFAVVNFGSNPEGSFAALRKVQPTGPLMCGEYYPGWFDSWGRAHHVGSTQNVVNELKWMLDHKASFSIYMAHGGTSFGFTAGANSPPFSPQSTSYDYDAPISEAGWDTPKFMAIRELFSKYLQPGETLPPVPGRNAAIDVPEFSLREFTPLLANLPKPTVSSKPLSLEDLNQPHGAVLYRATLPAGPAARLLIRDVHDYAKVLLDGRLVATLDRRRGQSSCALPERARASRLDILVDTFGRVNYGSQIHDRKGITQGVALVTPQGEREILGWQHFKLPMDAAHLASLGRKYLPLAKSASAAQATALPGFYRGAFEVKAVGDTFLDTSQWGKGVAWVNGHNLGRFWKVGPQQTMYVPAAWLKPGRNEVVVYESEGASAPTLQGRATPILDQVNPEPSRAHRKDRQSLKLDGLMPTYTGALANSDQWQTVTLAAPAKGRYLTIEALNSHPGDDFASLAELYAVGADGRDLDRSAWKTLYADSEEFGSEDGSADNVFDLQPTTLWHTQWSGNPKPKHPHQIVIDLGQDATVSALRMLQRAQSNGGGRIKDFRAFLTATPPPGL